MHETTMLCAWSTRLSTTPARIGLISDACQQVFGESPIMMVSKTTTQSSEHAGRHGFDRLLYLKCLQYMAADKPKPSADSARRAMKRDCGIAGVVSRKRDGIDRAILSIRH
jgi:hypothetical protein